MARARSDSPLLFEILERPDFSIERKAIAEGLWPVAGMDEAGRGPLAGPVVAAAVVLDGAVETIVGKTGRTADEARANLARSNPQGRLVAPQEVADAVLWLVSEGAGAITGQAIAVAGGEVMAG